MILPGLSHYRLVIACDKCNDRAEFTGTTLADAMKKAQEHGWTFERQGEKCPKCGKEKS